jgi:hypothetical protein
MSSSTISVSALVPLRAQLAEALANLDKVLGSSGGAATGKSGRTKKEKKVSKRAGRPTVLGDFTKKLLAERPDEVKAYKEANPDKKGAHLSYVSEYKKAHEEEWKAFEAAWKEAHPKEEAPADSASEASDAEASDSASATPSEKPKRVLSEEHKAKLKAGREAAKAKKEAEKAAAEAAAKDGAAPAPAPAPAEKPKKAPKKAKKASEVDAPPAPPAPVVASEPEEEAETELLPFSLGKVKYLRPGIRRADGNHLWSTGDLWENNKGAKGDYVGCLQDDGNIDASAEEPELD